MPQFHFKIKSPEDQAKIDKATQSGKTIVKTQSNPKFPNVKRIVYNDGTYDEVNVIK